jgi:hypothetical protein
MEVEKNKWTSLSKFCHFKHHNQITFLCFASSFLGLTKPRTYMYYSYIYIYIEQLEH